LDARGYYSILEVSEKATFQEIRRSYRKLARKYHPDRNGASAADDMIKKINQAFETLSDRDKRRDYDSQSLLKTLDSMVQVQSADIFESGSQPERKTTSTFYSTTVKNSQSGGSNQSMTMLANPKSRFHIIIEPSLCLAFGGCESIAPRVFTVDKNKRINPKARVRSETGEELERILLAAQACPTKAIKIIDRYNGDQLYP
jgi:DnaJ-class molecular chaperone with C-terminal Zn finger domain